MTTDAMFAVFEDFNDVRDEPPPAPEVEEPAPAFDPIGQIREEAWTAGYLTGRQEPAGDGGEPGLTSGLTAKLVTSLHELDAKTADAVDAASLAVADLLVTTVIAVASDEWPRKLLSRVRMVADRIKPALTVEPEFLLRDDSGTERRFGDIASLSRALDDGIVGEDVTIKWQRGEATISRTALLEDLREAVSPLSAGLVNEQSQASVMSTTTTTPTPPPAELRDATEGGSVKELEAVYDISVTVSAVLGKATMQVSQLLKLGRGAVVELDRRLGEAIDIYVNNRLIARGEVVMVDNTRLGVTMTEIVKSDR